MEEESEELTKEDIEKWKKAGKIAAQALEYGGGLIKKGTTLLEVSDLIEKKIEELGAIPAFPVQIYLAPAWPCPFPSSLPAPNPVPRAYLK